MIFYDGFDGIRIKAEGTPPLQVWFDEIKIGRTYADVSPYIETDPDPDPDPEPVRVTSPNDQAINIYPNPSSEQVIFEFSHESRVLAIDILDATGKLVRRLQNIDDTAIWSLTDRNGNQVLPGVYLYQAHFENNQQSVGRIIIKN